MNLRRWPPAVVDVVVAAAVAAVVCVAIHIAYEPGAYPPDLGAYFLGTAIGAVLLARRTHPLGVLAATTVLLFVYYTVEYPGIEPALPLAAALYTACTAGRLKWSAGVAAFFVGADLVVHGVRLGDPPLPLLTNIVQDSSLLIAVMLLGDTVRNRRIRLAEAQARLEESEAQREREAAQRVTEERLRIAREVHDIIGHSISAITVQAGLAQDVLKDRPEAAEAALRVVRQAARDAMSELKATVGLLRAQGEDEWSPAPTLAAVDDLAELARQAGVAVSVTVDGEARPLPGVVDASAYRIVQESLTNVVRHSGAQRAAVGIRYLPRELVIEVNDDGRGPSASPSGPPGFGLTGMGERVAAFGGQLETGGGADGGFRVCARLPVEEQAEEAE
ncbi:sensor histidine kinase [Streptomyces canus]|uniref:sensor histidine kinase n=1 Tax=Streptomyces canus TaxID=58343 RepID=UPI00278B497A|nr:sensor histidine kinase [Streptomyces canus]MDQ0762614.1 signal transduction histidine kinase [Streptomyces canus]MDQ1068942.1 signal transduction histidine kinase [Streptomyces canus]